MKRSISMLAAGLLAAATILATAGAASASATSARRASCSSGTLVPIFFTSGSTSYYVGMPNKVKLGSIARLKPTQNGSTTWCFTNITDSTYVVTSLNGGLALTSRATLPGSDVTVTVTGNGGAGFASQRWTLTSLTGGTGLVNGKTGLLLRIRNSGPFIGQTVTTGAVGTPWLF